MRVILFFFCLIVSAKSFSQDTTKAYIFGHSLIDHRPPAIPTPSDETTVPHWLWDLSRAAGYNFAAGGQYGFLPQHANLPPISQWGYEFVPPVWESDFEPFSAADIDLSLITAGNFMQWQSPDLPYPGQGGITPISATLDIADWLDDQEPGISIYIYENWPDMAPYLQSGFPPNSVEWNNYNVYLLDDFHDWWIDYHDSLATARPALDIKMIPVGPIISNLLLNTSLSNIPLDALYEDDAPHGQSSICFLAGMITYSAIYNEMTPENYVVPVIVHDEIRSLYPSLRQIIWDELKAFNFPGGRSRVFFEQTTAQEFISSDNFKIYPNPAHDLIRISGIDAERIEIIDLNGRTILTFIGQNEIKMSTLSRGVYYVRITGFEGEIEVEKVILR